MVGQLQAEAGSRTGKLPGSRKRRVAGKGDISFQVTPIRMHHF